MVGVYFLREEDAKDFCQRHGYPCDTNEWNNLKDGETHLIGFSVCNLDTWSGDRYIVGFYVKGNVKVLKEKFKDVFGVDGESFTETLIT